MTEQELEKIKNLKDYAELALVSYCTGLRSGMFMIDSVGYRDDNISDREYSKLPTYFEALTTTSHLWQIWKDDFKVGFTNNQAKNFIHRYNVIYHIDDSTNWSGFSATLFQHKQSKEFIFAIRWMK